MDKTTNNNIMSNISGNDKNLLIKKNIEDVTTVIYIHLYFILSLLQMTQSLFTTNSFISPVKNKIIPRRTKSNYKINFPQKLPISIKYPKSSPRIKIKNNRLKQNVIKVKRKKLFEPEIKNTQINKNKNIKQNKKNINIILSEKIERITRRIKKK